MPDALLPEDSALAIMRIAVALAIGFLIGLERGLKNRLEKDGERLAGFRTYALYGLAGGLAGVFPPAVAPYTIAAVLIGATALVVAGYVGALKADEPDRGLTSEVAAIATVALGALAGQGELMVAAAGAVLVVLVLSVKKQLHSFLDLVRYDEVRAGVKLLVMSVLVLPFLPDQGFGPGGVLNPYQIWWAVVLVASLSFAGYIAIRVFGAKTGPLAFGLVGGVASSTAVTVTSSRLAKASPNAEAAFAGAIGCASAVMMARVSILLAVFAPALLALAWPALAAGAAASIVAGFALALTAPRRTDGEALTLPPPDDVWFAVIFGGLLAAIGVGIYYAEQYFGHYGVFALAGISGLVDVDAFTLAATRNAAAGAALEPLRDALLLSVGVNTVVKAVIATSIGTPALGRRVWVIVAVSLLAGAAAWAVS